MSAANVLGLAFRHVVRPAHLKMRQLASEVVDRRLGVETVDESVAKSLQMDVDAFRETRRSLGWSGTWRLIRHRRSQRRLRS